MQEWQGCNSKGMLHSGVRQEDPANISHFLTSNRRKKKKNKIIC
jgi:hypothetical protein